MQLPVYKDICVYPPLKANAVRIKSWYGRQINAGINVENN
ncbi:hypothetical protein MmTuc01_2207 [Methanosarcina mazei Tuc01]|uniref:Uncharacterized protein n=1 Tax=Methanosarcina mazei Tuc01 TaxID=1236903 RepID=M1QKN5_METMZ|nr:hypothetical protein MmTuc01_2207 [Methanosarcina mazei Tuc01]